MRRKHAIASRKTGQRIHAKRRASERYGVNVTTRDIKEIVSKIINNQSKMLHRQSHSRSVREVEHDGKVFVVVYDHKRKNICTFLPPEAVIQYSPLAPWEQV